jgi:hypothetical protein
MAAKSKSQVAPGCKKIDSQKQPYQLYSPVNIMSLPRPSQSVNISAGGAILLLQVPHLLQRTLPAGGSMPQYLMVHSPLGSHFGIEQESSWRTSES